MSNWNPFNHPFFRDTEDWFNRRTPFLSLTNNGDDDNEHKDNNSRAIMSPLNRGNMFHRGNIFPPMQIQANENDHTIQCEVPGVKKEDLNIELNDTNDGRTFLTISGEKKDNSTREDKERGYYSEFRSYGSFSRSVQVPNQTKPEDIRADYVDGVLKVTVPKGEEEANKQEPRRIQIN